MSQMIDTIIISLLTGIISGLLSGWIVTKYFRNVDSKNEISKNKSKCIDAFTEYLNELEAETKLAEKNKDYSEIYRLIKKRSVYLFELYSVLGETAQEKLRDVESKLCNIEEGIEKKTTTPSNIKTEIRSILIIMLEIIAKSMSEKGITSLIFTI